MTEAEIIVLILALVLLGTVTFAPSLPIRTGALLTTLALVATALVVLHQWSR